jgi:protein SCO1/2
VNQSASSQPAAVASEGRRGSVKGAPLYDLELVLLNQDGKKLHLDAFRGHRVLISMFYGSCPYACPTLISDVRRLERRLSPAVRADLRVLLVSFDPDRDTPSALLELMKTRDLDRSRWALCTTSDRSTRDLAAVLGIKFRKLPNGGFNHTSLLTVLDRDGTVLAHSEGLEGENDDLALALHEES